MRAGRREGMKKAAAVQAACRNAPTVEVAVRAREKRTSNIQNMLVTLDVSKLSGWLKAFAKKNMSSIDVTLDVSRLSG